MTILGVAVETSFDNGFPPMKGGQLSHTLYTVINKMWMRDDNPVTSAAASYHGTPFTNIDITISPVPFQSHQTLTLVKIQFGLVTIMSRLQEKALWPSLVTARILDRLSAHYIGIIKIIDSFPSDPLVNDNVTILNAIQGNDSTVTATTGEGIANFAPTCKDTERLCRPIEIVAAGEFIPDKIWLDAFHSIISRCFVHDQFSKIGELLPPSHIWSATDGRGIVEMTLQFYDAAVSSLAPMYLNDLVSGLLTILRQWAQRDVWKEGWGLIEKGGYPEASLQIKLIHPQRSVADA